jgi:hypothetical protein
VAELLVVTGSRVLADTPDAEAWARGVLGEVTAALPPVAVLYAGGAAGPDTWAADLARERGLSVIEYRLDGNRWTLSRLSRAVRPYAPWCEWEGVRARPGDRRWPLERNRVMIDHAALLARTAAVNLRHAVRVLALVAPWSRTHGTQHTVRLARAAGLAVDVRECPAAYGPREARRG